MKKSLVFIENTRLFALVGEDGFEPSKSLTTDLQSAPFGRSGTPPWRMRCITLNDAEKRSFSKRPACGTMELVTRLERVTCSLQVSCSTN